jgi:hypothetical protein
MLVISQGSDGYGGLRPPKVLGADWTCFDPNPADTRGEAEFIGKLARRCHWQSVVMWARGRRTRVPACWCSAASAARFT